MLRAGSILCAAVLFGQMSRADQVDDYIRSEMRAHNIPGVSLRVLRQTQTVKSATYGLANVELNVPVQPDSLFEIGSLTKQFTATAILLLAQDGKLSVDDQVRQHLPEAPNAWAGITLRHLLTHTSGLKSYTGLDGFELRRHLSHTDFIKAIAAQPVEFKPGEGWKYCNTGYNLLGFVIERVSGRSYWDFLSDRILRPLGMNSTSNRLPTLVLTNRVAGYEQTNHVLINRDPDLTDVFSAGALVSTAPDLARWCRALDGEELLTPATKRLMWTPVRLNDGRETKYGFGWFIDRFEGHLNTGHGGSTSGFSASIQRFPEDELTVILLTNTDEQVAPKLARQVAALYFLKSAAPRGR